MKPMAGGGAEDPQLRAYRRRLRARGNGLVVGGREGKRGSGGEEAQA